MTIYGILGKGPGRVKERTSDVGGRRGDGGGDRRRPRAGNCGRMRSEFEDWWLQNAHCHCRLYCHLSLLSQP